VAPGVAGRRRRLIPVPAHNICWQSKLAIFFKKRCTFIHVADWGFLTNHARVLLHIAHDPGARLRDILGTKA